MKLSPEQKQAVEHDGHLSLVSCPGSGKTRTIVAKLLRCIDDVRETNRRVACITYTHAGVNEISSRLREWGSFGDDTYCEVGTIHAFCLNNILRSYAHLVPELAGDWSVTSSDDDWFRQTAATLRQKHNLRDFQVDALESVQREFPTGLFVPNSLTLQIAQKFCYLCLRDRKVTFSDIVFYSTWLVATFPYISRALAARFQWIVVDEFQDTTVTQVALLERIVAHGLSKVFIVGDPNQSILGFAGAKPGLMQQFAHTIGAASHVRLSGNYRCSTKVVELAERLCPCDPAMAAVGATRNHATDPIYVHCTTAIEGVFEHFLNAADDLRIANGERAVLAPWWTSLVPIGRELRNREVPVYGPGSRPYRRTHQFATLAEHLCAYLTQPDAEHALAVQKALFFTLLSKSDRAAFRVYSYFGKRVVFRLIYEARRLRDVNEQAVAWLRATAAGVEAILVEEGLIPPEHDALTQSVRAMEADMRQRGVDMANLSVAELGLFASPKNCVQLLTMHSAKGREFDAVAVIDFHDNKVPNFNATEPDDIAEFRRLSYVAATRARKLLMFFTNDDDRGRNMPSRFLREMQLT